MSKIKELYTYSTDRQDVEWNELVKTQLCRYSNKKCYKVRKSIATTSIGTCTVQYGKNAQNVIICPLRLLERKQIFTDCVHLLTSHTPGNELHIVSEVKIPGGNVDYFLVSADSNHKVKDFVGIELQTVDTSGSLWYERELALKERGVIDTAEPEKKGYGMNWKMTAKTILVQLHHKIQTFENLNKHLVLVTQDCLLNYIKKEFSSEHLSMYLSLGDSMHFLSYKLTKDNCDFKLSLDSICGTNSKGLSKLLGLNADANLEIDEITRILESKISNSTLFTVG